MARARARDSTSPTPEAFPRADQSYAGNSEEIQPLAFETEAELFSVLARLRDGLKVELSRKWLAEGGDPEGIEAVEGLVLNVRPLTRSLSTMIAARPQRVNLSESATKSEN